MWSIRTDQLLCLDTCGSSVRMISDMSRHARSCRLLIWQWTVGTSVYHVRTRSLQVFSAACFLNHTHTSAFFIVLSCHVVCFSHGFLPRFWFSLHISSHSIVFVVSSFVLLSFCVFLNIGIFGDWNIFLRYCAWKSYSICVLGWS
jgi:hypothetical protein